MLYVGLMCGTSVDGIDAVLVELKYHPAGIRLVAARTFPFPDNLNHEIETLIAGDELDHHAVMTVDQLLGKALADSALALLEDAGVKATDITAIGSHGQTLKHRPDVRPPWTLQVGSGAIIAERSGITTVTDFRSRDMAAGGQGAPLVPAFHQWLFHSGDEDRAIINIGGIANVTFLPARGAVTGFDTGPGNTLLDAWCRRHTGKPYDVAGAWSTLGTPNEALLERFLDEPYFARPAPKSTGRELFNLDWLRLRGGALLDEMSPEDVQATLVQLSASTIARGLATVSGKPIDVYVCGGGVHNDALLLALNHKLARDVRSTEAVGLHPDWVEAVAFAWLAGEALAGRPGNLPAVTGARRATVLGAIYGQLQ